MNEHWPVKRKGTRSLDSLVEEDVGQTNPPRLADDYGESLLAEALGVPPAAAPVEVAPDSPIPPDTFVGADGIYLEPEYSEAEPAQPVEPEPVGKPVEEVVPPCPDTLLDESQPDSAHLQESLPITPTELENTPEIAKVVDMVESPMPLTTTVKDPLPNVDKYTPEDQAALQLRTDAIKQLGWDLLGLYGDAQVL